VVRPSDIAATKVASIVGASIVGIDGCPSRLSNARLADEAPTAQGGTVDCGRSSVGAARYLSSLQIHCLSEGNLAGSF